MQGENTPQSIFLKFNFKPVPKNLCNLQHPRKPLKYWENSKEFTLHM